MKVRVLKSGVLLHGVVDNRLKATRFLGMSHVVYFSSGTICSRGLNFLQVIYESPLTVI